MGVSNACGMLMYSHLLRTGVFKDTLRAQPFAVVRKALLFKECTAANGDGCHELAIDAAQAGNRAEAHSSTRTPGAISKISFRTACCRNSLAVVCSAS